MGRPPTFTDEQRAEVARSNAARAAVALAAFVEDVEWMASTGESTEDVARRRGVSPQAINKRLLNAGRSDLWEQLRANEVRRFGETLGDRRNRENGQSARKPVRGMWVA